MKIFTPRIFTHKKIIFIFLLAIFLPLLIVGYLSLSTFSKRREAVRKLLESNLWVSGEAALKSVEGALLEHEQKALRSENFIRLIQSKKADQDNFISSRFSEDSVGHLFLLDADFKIIFPETGSENASEIQFEKEIQNSQFAQFFQRAEFFEFSKKNYTRAAELYKECTLSAPSDQFRAIAFEGLGRCLLSSEEYDEAYKVYNKLSENYGQLQNMAGHPYGIVAIFQLYEIAREKKEEEHSLGIFLDLYEKIREGIWLINRPAYDFYIAEIESILNSKFIEGKFPEIQKSYTDIQKQLSPYRQTLLFTDFLERNAIPGIKEKLSLSRTEGEVTQERFPGASEDDFFLVSYAILPYFQSEQTFYGGFCWDLNLLKNQIITKILEDISKESGLDFKLIDERNQNITTGEEEFTSEESLVLTFRMFPLPWKLLVSHPEIKAIEKTARREIFFYGFLLIVIVTLMLLGAVLIARDISRESETNRLKTEFVNNISHELKTPLTLIRLYGETLQHKENLTNIEKKECYEIITRESERLSHLINNVLDFSRIEMGRKEFDFKKGYLQDVVIDTLESYRYHLEKKGFVILSDIARDLPEMNFDGEAIASVLINLLSNAMKFSLKEKEVTVKLFRDNGNAVLQVADKGIGISQKEISKIFLRFYQSENKIASEARGSGLGLTLVKHITEAHGGTIEVESEVGKGSRFTVRIPLCGLET
ncbi:MAG TPA: ATP-binding protein [Bacteroidales bacterium]|nr:ATP-binding protein [Bacteroidales bacterium]